MMPPIEKKQTLPGDVLGNLPENVIDDILIRLPLRDAVRTSILSKKWRYNWCRLPELTLDDTLCENKRDLIYPTTIFRKIIHNILTLHAGPITKFTLCIPYLSRCPNIDESLFYFISSNGIQHLVLKLPRKGKQYKLPCLFFTCFQLRHLTLEYCSILPPPSFRGFDKLISLELCCVTISPMLLESFISHCPLLQQLVLTISIKPSNVIEINAPFLKSFEFNGSLRYICVKNTALLLELSLKDWFSVGVGSGKCKFAESFESFSALERLHLDNFSLKLFAAGTGGELPTRLPFNLDSVKHLSLSRIFLDNYFNDVPYALCLIRSLPFLQYMEIKVVCYSDKPALECLEVELSSDVMFSHLREVKLKGNLGNTRGMQLIKLMLAKSPVLVRMLIEPYHYEESVTVKILAELSRFHRASPKAEVVYNCPV